MALKITAMKAFHGVRPQCFLNEWLCFIHSDFFSNFLYQYFLCSLFPAGVCGLNKTGSG
jgi:hypothetical protein